MHLSGTTRIRVLILLVLGLIIWLLIRNWTEIGLASKENMIIKPSGTPVLVTVYYEALCPDSKHFIIKQLQTAFQRAPDLIDIQLVPYGKATTSTNNDGSLKFDCQHGPIECQANIIHSCVIDVVKHTETTLKMIGCMISDNLIPRDSFHRCAKEYSIDSQDRIQKCYDGVHGAELLKIHGEQTHALRPKVSFIPTVTLDGGQFNQAAILKNLFNEICNVVAGRGPMPDICVK